LWIRFGQKKTPFPRKYWDQVVPVDQIATGIAVGAIFLNPIPEDDMNTIPVPSMPHYQKILAQFKPEYHEALKVYTAEELYVAYRIMSYVPKRNRHGDIPSKDLFILTLQAKMRRYLKGEGKCIHPSAWDKIGKMFRHDFEESVLSTLVSIDQAKVDLSAHFSHKR
jgi:hypothetical protein